MTTLPRLGQAEILGDRPAPRFAENRVAPGVAIMAEGRLAVCGSSLFLKAFTKAWLKHDLRVFKVFKGKATRGKSLKFM